METADLARVMAETARTAGLSVRHVRGRPVEDDAVPTSGVCRLQGEVLIVLCAADPPSVHVDVLTKALRDHARDFVESHFVPPAIRERVGGPGIG